MRYLKVAESDRYELASPMEFILDALHQHSKIAKDEVDRITSYTDMVGSIFVGRDSSDDEQ